MARVGRASVAYLGSAKISFEALDTDAIKATRPVLGTGPTVQARVRLAGIRSSGFAVVALITGGTDATVGLILAGHARSAVLTRVRIARSWLYDLGFTEVTFVAGRTDAARIAFVVDAGSSVEARVGVAGIRRWRRHFAIGSRVSLRAGTTVAVVGRSGTDSLVKARIWIAGKRRR